MHIRTLGIDNFRCLKNCRLRAEPGINCIVGDNASGKTSLLESIYLLGRGHSFRQNRLSQAINHEASAFTLTAQVVNSTSAREKRLACHATRQNLQFKLDDQTSTRRFDLINTLPLQHIDPNVHKLLEQGPQHRRHFLDWGVFHVEQAFFPAWRRYRRALKQRNRALRHQRPKYEIIAWDAELVEQGEIVDACRRRYLSLVKKQLPANASALIGEDQIDFAYHPGWKSGESYGNALLESLEQDIKARFTQNGPHRADIRINVASAKARDWVSRGQQKILTSALLLAQAHILYEVRGLRPVLLIDDMAAELGQAYREALAQQIARSHAQCFVTFLDDGLVPIAFAGQAMFHVEHGTLTST